MMIDAQKESGKMKEFHLTIKVANNLLRQRREASGLAPKDLAEKIGQSYGAYIRLENMKSSPLRFAYECRFPDCGVRAVGCTQFICKEHRGVPGVEEMALKTEPTAVATALCEFWGCAFDELFPRDVLDVQNSTIEASVEANVLRAIGSVGYLPMTPEQAEEAARCPEHRMLQREEAGHARELLAGLQENSPRLRKLIEARFFPGKDNDTMTLKQAGALLGVSLERARQMEIKALRTMRALHRRSVT